MSIHLPISYSKVKIWIVAIIIATNEGITKVLSNFNITTFVYSLKAKIYKFVRTRQSLRKKEKNI